MLDCTFHRLRRLLQHHLPVLLAFTCRHRRHSSVLRVCYLPFDCVSVQFAHFPSLMLFVGWQEECLASEEGHQVCKCTATPMSPRCLFLETVLTGSDFKKIWLKNECVCVCWFFTGHLWCCVGGFTFSPGFRHRVIPGFLGKPVEKKQPKTRTKRYSISICHASRAVERLIFLIALIARLIILIAR